MTPQERIITIRKSLRVFCCGLASLLPIIGLVPAACALVGGWRLRPFKQTNPARRYVKVGFALAIIGILLTTGLTAAIVLEQFAPDIGEPGC
jgi:hypothetical protein